MKGDIKFHYTIFLCVEKCVDLTFQACSKGDIKFLCRTFLCVKKFVDLTLQACHKSDNISLQNIPLCQEIC